MLKPDSYFLPSELENPSAAAHASGSVCACVCSVLQCVCVAVCDGAASVRWSLSLMFDVVTLVILSLRQLRLAPVY